MKIATQRLTVNNKSEHRVTALLALVQIVAGALALRATLIHADAYSSVWQWRAEMVVFAALCLSGLGLLRRRRWAARLSAAFLYLVFFLVMVAISLLFDQHRQQWWYWALPLCLPLLGGCLYVLRKCRGDFH